MSDENRVSLFGTDADHNVRRMLDIVMDDGTPYIETKDKNGHLVRTTVIDMLITYKELKRKCAG